LLFGGNLIFCVAVNCFVMISGYFLIYKTSYRWNSLIRLWLQVLFYSVMITFVCWAMFGSKIDYTAFFPVSTKKYWFVTSYIGLMLIAPFLSKLAVSLSKRQYAFMLVLLFIIDFKYPFGRLYSNYDSIIHFASLFLGAGYLRMFGNPIKIIKPWTMFLIIWLFVLGVFMLYNFHRGVGDLKNTGYNGLILFISIAFFLVVMEGKWFDSNFMKGISKLAPYCFGVYLIHDNVQVRHLLWDYVSSFHFDSWYLLITIAVSLIVFLICIFFDFIRTKIFSLLRIDNLAITISEEFPNI